MFKPFYLFSKLQKLFIKRATKKVAGQSPAIGFTAIIEQTHYKKDRRVKPATGFILFVVALKANCCSLVGDLQSYGSIDFLLTA